MKRILIVALAILFGYQVHLKAQEGKIKFQRISLEQGLSQNTVNSIVQDNDGFMWFGTFDGLNKYDGYKITVFRHNPDDATTVAENAINVIFEDKDKNLWIGTGSNGISRYDKQKANFVSYRKSQTTKTLLSSNNIKTVFQDSKGQLWFGTDNGINKLVKSDGPSGEIDFKPFMDNNSDFQIQVNKITEFETEMLWIATAQGIVCFSLKSEQIVQNTKDNPFYNCLKDLERTPINTLFVDKTANLWIGTDNGLKKLERKSGKLEPVVLAGKKASGNAEITAIFEDNAGELWIGSRDGGLYKYDAKLNTFTCYQNDPSDVNSLSANSIATIYQDKFNILWIGTNLGGINKWDRTAAAIALFRNNPFDDNSLSSSRIRSILQDKEGTLWIGTVDKGLNKWNLATNKFTHYLHQPENHNSIAGNHVRAIIQDSKGLLWIGTDGGGLDRFDPKTEQFTHFVNDPNNPKSLSNNQIWAIYEDRNQKIWVATFGGGACRLDNQATQQFTIFRNDPKSPNSLSDDKVTTVYQDKKGIYWIGTFGGGLNRFDISANTFKRYDYDETHKNSLWNDRIYCIMEDTDGYMWLGTKGSLNCFEPRTETFTRYTEEQGLPNNVIMGILEDSQNNLWLSTNNGIARFNKKTKVVRNYDINNGLQSNEFLVGAYFKAKDGKFYFGGVNGLNAFYPDKVITNNIPPQIVIYDFSLFNRKVQADENSVLKKSILQTNEINLNWDQNVFSFEFASLHYSQPEKNSYAYMLEGFDVDWIHVDSYHRFASYTNLEPGQYIFKVKGTNSDGIWSDKIAEVKIIITPPFWKTAWFRIILIISILSAIIGFFRYRIGQIERQKANLEKVVTERTAEVEYQKNELSHQRDLLMLKNKEIEAQNSQIKSSIGFAISIQNDILAVEQEMNQMLDSFIFFKPKEPISSDFFWFDHDRTDDNAKFFIAIVNSTGKGIQAAYMAMLTNRLLSKLVKERKIFNPAVILEQIDSSYHCTFENALTESMEISICCIEEMPDDTIKVSFAGAKRPLYYFTVEPLAQYVIEGTPRKIGISESAEESVKFELKEITLNRGDVICLSTDGIFNQLDPNGVPMGWNRLGNVIRLNSHLPAYKIRDIVHLTLDLHQKEALQTDDVTFIGIKLT